MVDLLEKFIKEFQTYEFISVPKKPYQKSYKFVFKDVAYQCTTSKKIYPLLLNNEDKKDYNKHKNSLYVDVRGYLENNEVYSVCQLKNGKYATILKNGNFIS